MNALSTADVMAKFAKILNDQDVPIQERYGYFSTVRVYQWTDKRYLRRAKKRGVARRNPNPRYYGGNRYVTQRIPY